MCLWFQGPWEGGVLRAHGGAGEAAARGVQGVVQRPQGGLPGRTGTRGKGGNQRDAEEQPGNSPCTVRSHAWPVGGGPCTLNIFLLYNPVACFFST